MSDDDFGSQIERALNAHASDAPRAGDLAAVARRRVRRRRTAMAGTVAVALAVTVGGVAWNAVGRGAVETASDSGSGAAQEPAAEKRNPAEPRVPTPGSVSDAGPASAAARCQPTHPVMTAGGYTALRYGISLHTAVTGAWACRYRTSWPPNAVALGKSPPPLLGSVTLDSEHATALLAAIRALPEVNPALPKIACAPEAANPREAIVLRFSTAAGVREIWVGYDGCATGGFYSADARRDLDPSVLHLFMTGPADPAQATWLNLLPGW